MSEVGDRINYLGYANHRGKKKLFGIKRRDRRSHLYALGKTGSGKTTLLRTILAQDLFWGEGLALFDPHGDLVESLLPLVPRWRRQDLVYLNVPDPHLRWHFNPLSAVAKEHRSLAAGGIVEVFRKLWQDDWGPRLEHVLRNLVFTLLELEDATLADLLRLLVDSDYRKGIVPRLENPQVQSFWRTEFSRFSPGFAAVVIAPIQNKVAAFLTDPLLRRILTEGDNSLDLRKAMDSGKILLVNLSKGKIGEPSASLLGSLLLAHLSLAALSRADQEEACRRDFFITLDEAHLFTTLHLASMLPELRKYRVGLSIAHQHLSQLDSDVRDAILGNAGTLLSFRLGGKDAPLLAREFQPTFSTEDLVNLPGYNFYLRLMIDGQVSKAFSAETIPTLDGLPFRIER